MRLCRHPRTGAIMIWARLYTGEYVTQTYYFYNMKEAIHLFRKKYPASLRETKGCEKSDWCPTYFG